MTTYHVRAYRDGTQWSVDVAEAPTAHTFAGNLTALDRNVREAIAVTDDLPEGAEATLDLVWDFEHVDPAIAEAAAVGRQRRRALHDVEAATARARKAAITLAAAGWSQRDIAPLLGLTAGRVSQILAEKHDHVRS
ncbi:hypothetical protein [Pseudoclavibacter soli]|uniref:hypothetical protein n=1 Tax=Pseudoclavibacter soli TaxID=452623 RepID=UPI0004108BA6|nr:hypothetical protein [Pseudoclavibacter soli]